MCMSETQIQIMVSEVPFDRPKYQAAIHELFPAFKNLIRVVAEKHGVDPLWLVGIVLSQIILNRWKVPRSYEVKWDEIKDGSQPNPTVAP